MATPKNRVGTRAKKGTVSEPGEAVYERVKKSIDLLRKKGGTVVTIRMNRAAHSGAKALVKAGQYANMTEMVNTLILREVAAFASVAKNKAVPAPAEQTPDPEG